ncbi:sigma-70 family RNA polymerase sigma factor [Aporhodopirellula aestuarii]|uniref:Sigma-70 family RNA polymerase sigma factor n=1 Tax=Aporhodopirellula aestuarii TaxID=2950107 RepID=A0ABT0TXF8_9BACT|nr:sigma-70 family RNA polymerase sigma factor [Aporhodopirellula aestuarii]MCM2369276.1 sigma-70 family RNA polymerase sigma factor [Aporhodopirellula aestuarii]
MTPFDSPHSKAETLVQLLSEHHDQLYRYIYSLVGTSHDARDVLQETSFALYEKFELFDSSRPFLPWAYKFAYIHVLKWRESQSRQMPLLSGDVLELLAQERQSQEGALSERLTMLGECMSQLPEDDLELVRSRYLEGLAPDLIAEKVNASRRTLFRDLKRIRHLLMNCIDKKLAMDEF